MGLRGAAASHKIGWREADRFSGGCQAVYRLANAGLKLALAEAGEEELEAARRAAVEEIAAQSIEAESEPGVVIEVDFRGRGIIPR